MSEIRRDEIVYEEGWRDAKTDDADEGSAELSADGADADHALPSEKNEMTSRPLLTVLQLILCMAAALVLFILKAMDSGAYHSFMKAYAEEMSKPVVSQKVFDAVDWNALFGGSHVSITATPDELEAR